MVWGDPTSGKTCGIPRASPGMSSTEYSEIGPYLYAGLSVNTNTSNFLNGVYLIISTGGFGMQIEFFFTCRGCGGDVRVPWDTSHSGEPVELRCSSSKCGHVSGELMPDYADQATARRPCRCWTSPWSF